MTNIEKIKRMKNKNLLLLIFATLLANIGNVKAQDTLYLKNGAKIGSKILEITPTEIKYKKFDNIEGPTYTTHGSDISLVKYKNGAIDTIKVEPPAAVVTKTPSKPAEPKPADPNPAITPFGPVFKYNGRHINAREAQKIMLTVNDSEINQHVKAAKFSKSMGLLGFVAIPTFIFGAGWSVFALANNNGSSSDMSYGPGIAGGAVAVACLATSITFNVRKKKNMNDALDLYNQKY